MILQIHYTTRTELLQNLKAHKLKERAKGAAIFCAKADRRAHRMPVADGVVIQPYGILRLRYELMTFIIQ